MDGAPMVFVRVIHVRHYDTRLGRFQSGAFKSKGGVSVFDDECARAASATTCQHIAKFYSAVVSAPPLFARVPRAAMPATATVVQTPSRSGDDCHFNIDKLSEGQSKTIVRDHIEGKVRRCDDELVPTGADFSDWRSQFEALLKQLQAGSK